MESRCSSKVFAACVEFLLICLRTFFYFVRCLLLVHSANEVKHVSWQRLQSSGNGRRFLVSRCCVLRLFISLFVAAPFLLWRFVPADLLDSGQSMRPVQNEYLQSLTRRWWPLELQGPWAGHLWHTPPRRPSSFTWRLLSDTTNEPPLRWLEAVTWRESRATRSS